MRLLAFDGTLIVVSHDREFLDGLVDKVFEFRNHKVYEHLGGIYDFLQRRKLASLRDVERKSADGFNGRKNRPSAGGSGNHRFPDSSQDAEAPEKQEEKESPDNIRRSMLRRRNWRRRSGRLPTG
jgi:ATP-binding cassette subfamily F protein 3